MKNPIEKSKSKFRSSLLSALGAKISFGVCILTATGETQKHIHFSGVFEEMVFFFFAFLLGISFLAMSISVLCSKD
jgi:hypothetical protein